MASADNTNFVRPASLADAVYERLRDEIMQGGIADGSRLNQVDLAARYGVSRIPIREALRRLQAESLVIATPHHPFVVRNVTAEQVLELVDIRAALEDFALSRRTDLAPETVVQLRRINKQMTRTDGEAFLALDREFHQLIAGPDTMVVELIGDVRDKVHKYISSMVAAKPGRTSAVEEHAGIVDALATGDMDLARRLMREHVTKSRAFIEKRLTAEVAGKPGEVDESGPRPKPARKPARR